jgi:hypothetical protein
VGFSVFRALVAKKELATKTQRRKRHTKLVFFVSGNRYVGVKQQKIAFSWDLLTTTIIFNGVSR